MIYELPAETKWIDDGFGYTKPIKIKPNLGAKEVENLIELYKTGKKDTIDLANEIVISAELSLLQSVHLLDKISEVLVETCIKEKNNMFYFEGVQLLSFYDSIGIRFIPRHSPNLSNRQLTILVYDFLKQKTSLNRIFNTTLTATK